MTVTQTASGRMISLDAPDPATFLATDIAWALARIPRFNGHTRGEPYSVAQHCVMVSRLVPAEHALQGLLHDAHEAYVQDVSSPLKRLLTAYHGVEQRMWRAVSEWGGVPFQVAPEVRRADAVALATERRDLLGPCLPEWEHVWRFLPAPDAQRIDPWPWRVAYAAWLDRWEQLTGEVAA